MNLENIIFSKISNTSNKKLAKLYDFPHSLLPYFLSLHPLILLSLPPRPVRLCSISSGN